MGYDTTLTPELREEVNRIRGYAIESGLEFFDVIFELVNHDELNEIAAYGGFPTRYTHWSHGMSYDQLARGYEFGLSKIFELVINNDPCYAYLMRSNEMVAQKLVIAHVYGHADFFRNNAAFSKTNRKMMDEIANHATRIRRYIDRYGIDEVETFIDACLSIEDLIDPFLPFAGKDYLKKRKYDPRRDRTEEGETIEPQRFATDKEYMDRYINPPERMAEERQRLRAAKSKEVERFPERDEKDVLLFLIEHAPLRTWQRDVLQMLRAESCYFAPQRQTKIMNEGWASYWHSTLMSQRICTAAEIVDYAALHSSVMGGSGLNPYRLGLELYRDIEDRWNRGRHGKDWEECQDRAARENWDTGAMAGREKIFQVRRTHNDVTFIDEYMTQDFCERNRLFVYEYNEATDHYVITSREFNAVKQKLLFQLTNFGQPFIYVRNANYGNRGELLLWHKHLGVDIRDDYAAETLANVQRIWDRPVHLATQIDGEPHVFSHDGEQLRQRAGEP